MVHPRLDKSLSASDRNYVSSDNGLVTSQNAAERGTRPKSTGEPEMEYMS
jgi:hypothetical protein